jgi:hypothetical protein
VDVYNSGRSSFALTMKDSVLFKAGQFKQAQDNLNIINFNEGIDYYLNGEFEMAQQQFDKTFNSGEKLADSLVFELFHYHGLSYYYQGEISQAKELLASLKDMAPNYLSGYKPNLETLLNARLNLFEVDDTSDSTQTKATNDIPCVIEQSNKDAYANIQTTTAFGQTFTACRDGFISKIRINLYSVEGNDVRRLRLQLSSGTNTLVPEYSQDFWVEKDGYHFIELNTPFPVKEGQLYSYTTIGTSGSGTVANVWALNDPDSYLDGSSIQEKDGKVIIYGSDQDFSIYIDSKKRSPVTTINPSKTIVALSGLHIRHGQIIDAVTPIYSHFDDDFNMLSKSYGNQIGGNGGGETLLEKDGYIISEIKIEKVNYYGGQTIANLQIVWQQPTNTGNRISSEMIGTSGQFTTTQNQNLVINHGNYISKLSGTRDGRGFLAELSYEESSLTRSESLPLPVSDKNYERTGTKLKAWNVDWVAYTNGINKTNPIGYFVNRENEFWEEITETGRVNFQFREQNRDEWSVYLYDISRNVSIQLDMHLLEVFYSDEKNSRRLLYYIEDYGMDERVLTIEFLTRTNESQLALIVDVVSDKGNRATDIKVIENARLAYNNSRAALQELRSIFKGREGWHPSDYYGEIDLISEFLDDINRKYDIKYDAIKAINLSDLSWEFRNGLDSYDLEMKVLQWEQSILLEYSEMVGAGRIAEQSNR